MGEATTHCTNCADVLARISRLDTLPVWFWCPVKILGELRIGAWIDACWAYPRNVGHGPYRCNYMFRCFFWENGRGHIFRSPAPDSINLIMLNFDGGGFYLHHKLINIHLFPVLITRRDRTSSPFYRALKAIYENYPSKYNTSAVNSNSAPRFPIVSTACSLSYWAFLLY